ncbi:hypothetical protein ACQPZZ_26240 [Microbispora sp. CA-135349]|uniref:hypothetical protein n=1 Tax=Microbispora sp. CA-135349 TaxID=3239953 RepID=UPI003D92117D
MLIRRENPDDVEAVRAVVAAAFAPYQAARDPGRPDGPPVEVGLLGDPAYYSRFGFEHSETYGVTAPGPKWGTFFQVRVFERPVPPPEGLFAYAKPFSGVDGG